MILTEHQRLLLLAIEQDTVPGERYWIARCQRYTIRKTAEEFICGGGGSARSLLALEAKGLIERPHGAPEGFKYAYQITDQGRAAVAEL